MHSEETEQRTARRRERFSLFRLSSTALGYSIVDSSTGEALERASEFFRGLQSRGKRRKTLADYLSVVASYLNFCVQHDMPIDHDGPETLALYIRQRVADWQDGRTTWTVDEVSKLVRVLRVASAVLRRWQSPETWTAETLAVRRVGAAARRQTNLLLDSIRNELMHDRRMTAAVETHTRGRLAEEIAADSLDDAMVLLSAQPNVDPRATMVMLLLYYTQAGLDVISGIRRSDLVLGEHGRLAVNRSAFSESSLIIPLSKDVVTLLQLVLSLYTPIDNESPWLVPSHCHKNTGGAMHPSALRCLVENAFSETGARFTCRQLQLAGAARAIKEGDQIEVVLQRLGRKSWVPGNSRELGIPELTVRQDLHNGAAIYRESDRKRNSGRHKRQ